MYNILEVMLRMFVLVLRMILAVAMFFSLAFVLVSIDDLVNGKKPDYYKLLLPFVFIFGVLSGFLLALLG